jgi:hypothetical protein
MPIDPSLAINASLLNAVLLLGSAALSVRIFKKESFTGFVAYTGFIFLCSIIGIQTIVGWLDLLSILLVSLLGYAWAITMLILGWKDLMRDCPRPKNYVWPMIFAPFGIFLFIELFNALLLPVWEYDSVSYHLPMVRDWLASGSLRDVYFSVYAGPVAYYPGTGELLTLWPIVLTGTDLFANTQNIFLLPLLFTVCLHLARRMGMRDRSAYLLPVLFCASPLLLKEIGTPHVDLLYALGFAYCLLAAWEFAVSGNRKQIVMAGLALGLFVGSKYLAVPVGGLYAIVFTVLLGRSIYKNHSIPTLHIFLGILGFFLIGGLWYVRNIMLTGNPIFPSSISIGPWTIAEGYGSFTHQAFSDTIYAQLPALTMYDMLDMAGQFVLRSGFQTVVMIIAYVLLLIGWIKSSRKIRWNNPAFFLCSYLALAFPFLLALYIVTPNSYVHFDANIRYALLALFHGALLIAYCAHTFPQLRMLIWTLTVVSIAASTIHAFITPDLPHELGTLRYIGKFPATFGIYAIKAVVVIAFIKGLFLLRTHRYRMPLLCAALVVSPALLILGNDSVLRIRADNQYMFLEAKYPDLAPLIHGFAWLEEYVPMEQSVAFSGFHFQSPLYRQDLRRDARYVSVNDCRDCNYADFRSEPEGVFARADKNIWLENLKASGVSHIMLFDELGYMEHENIWVNESPERFEQTFAEDDVRILRVLP